MASKQLQLRRPTAQVVTADPLKVEAIINRGGSSATPAYEKERATSLRKSVIVYFDPEVLSRVDRARENLRIKTSRQRWLMEAILEKLDRSGDRDR